MITAAPTIGTPGQTPGPWEAIRGAVIATSPIGTHFDAENCDYFGGPVVCESIVTNANARLIAAAPDLLEALIMVRDADNDRLLDDLLTMPVVARAKIDAAIAKAGESVAANIHKANAVVITQGDRSFTVRLGEHYQDELDFGEALTVVALLLIKGFKPEVAGLRDTAGHRTFRDYLMGIKL